MLFKILHNHYFSISLRGRTRGFLIFLFFLSFPVYAQEPDSAFLFNNSQVIDSIKIIGNDVTEEFIILRELTFETGDTVSQALLEFNRDRIYSLGLFTKVDLIPTQMSDKNVLFIIVEESWYIYPIPILEVKDRDWDKLSYGVIIVLKNFRGRNETLSGTIALGYDPSFSLSYYKPSIVWKSDIYLNARISYGTIINKSSRAKFLYGRDFEQTFSGGSIGIGNRFGAYHRLGINIGYNYIESPAYIKGISASDQRIDRFVFFNLGYSYDSRDLIFFPREGLYTGASVVFNGLGMNGIDYQVYNFDFREYRKLIGELSGKWRIAARFTSGKLVPYYDFSFIGYQERIRGHFSYEREGHHSYVGSVELNYPIIKEMDMSLDFIPLIPKELLRYRIALYSQLFSDTGATQLRGEPLSITDFDSGYGIGITLLILPYNVFRLEYALDDNQNAEFIFDLSVSF
jgi:outer membrane protein assembly factor BamA